MGLMVHDAGGGLEAETTSALDLEVEGVATVDVAGLRV